MAKFTFLGDIVNHTTSVNCIPCSPPLKAVGTKEEIKGDYLRAVGHICNLVEEGYRKFKSVRIVGWRQALPDYPGELSRGVTIDINRPGERYSGLEIRVKCGRNSLPQSFYDRISEYVVERVESGSSVISTKQGVILIDNLDESQFQEYGIDHTKEIEIIEDDNICREHEASLMINTRSSDAGYLVVDVLRALNVQVKPDNFVSVRDERTFWDNTGDVMFNALTYPLGMLFDKIDRAYQRLTLSEKSLLD